MSFQKIERRDLTDRIYAATHCYDHETLAVFNTSSEPVEAQVLVEPASDRWRAIKGDCAAVATAAGSYRVRVAPLDYLICRSDR